MHRFEPGASSRRGKAALGARLSTQEDKGTALWASVTPARSPTPLHSQGSPDDSPSPRRLCPRASPCRETPLSRWVSAGEGGADLCKHPDSNLRSEMVSESFCNFSGRMQVFVFVKKGHTSDNVDKAETCQTLWDSF